MIHVIATVNLKPGCREKFLEIFNANVPNVLHEDGCLSYEPCIDVDSKFAPANPDRVTIVESWESLDHLNEHLQAPHMKTYSESVKDLRISIELKIVKPDINS